MLAGSNVPRQALPLPAGSATNCWCFALCNTWSLSRGLAGREVWEPAPGMLPGQPAVPHREVAAEPRSWHSGLGMLLHSPPPQEQNQGRFCHTLFYFILFLNSYPGAGENSPLVFKFCAKIPQILPKLPNFFSFPAISGLHCPPKHVE